MPQDYHSKWATAPLPPIVTPLCKMASLSVAAKLVEINTCDVKYQYIQYTVNVFLTPCWCKQPLASLPSIKFYACYFTSGNNSCRYPLVLSANRSACEPPCDWSFISSSERTIYDSVLVNCLRIALVAMVITFVTWSSCKSM